jgi:ribonuclease BN (tRNA processing enzyme)
MSVRLEVIGSSPAWPNPGGAHSGYVVEADGRRLLLDCGPGVLPRLRSREPWPQVDAIAITHFHLDHWGDLIPWVWGAMFSANGADDVEPHRPQLLVHPGGHDRLRAFGDALGFPDMFDWVFEVGEYPAEEPVEVAGFRLTALRLPHYTLETYGFRVEADGACLAYSGDSGPSERLAELADGAHLFVCEATLAHGDADGTPRGHLSIEEALEAYEASRAGRLLLTHRPSELPVPDGLELAYDGMELVVGAS